MEAEKVEIEKCLIKTDWQEQRQRKTLKQNLVSNETGEEPLKADPNTLDFSVIRPTEFKNIKRVYMSENDDDKEVARRQFLKEELLKVAENYVKSNCQRDGKLKNSNLSKSQEKTLRNLQNRMKSENICVYETDKTSKFVVDSVENLKNKMEIHVNPFTTGVLVLR